MRYIKTICLSLFLTLSVFRTSAQVGEVIGGLFTAIGGFFVGNALDKLGDDINRAVTRAGSEGNYLLESAANKASLLLSNANNMLDNQRRALVKDLSAENQALIKAICEIVESFDKGIQAAITIEDYVALDIQNIINQLPFKKDVYLLRRIYGYSQVYRSKGNYTVRLIGGAYGPEYSYDIVVNDIEINTNNIKTPAAYTLEFTIPDSIINSLFNDTKVNRVNFSVVSKISKKRKEILVFEYENKLVLLPKLPFKYELIETVSEKSWSNEWYWSTEGHNQIPATGKEFKWESGSVTTTIPDGCLMLKGSGDIAMSATPGSHMRWDGISYSNTDRESNSDKTITLKAAHYIHDQPTHLYLKVKYKKPVYSNSDKPIFLSDTKKEVKDYLGFGTYLTNLSEKYVTYTIKLTLFSGLEFILTPGSKNNNYISTRIENIDTNKRLIVEIKPPTESVFLATQ